MFNVKVMVIIILFHAPAWSTSTTINYSQQLHTASF